jgi:transcription elongation factor Elf1
MSYHPGKNVKKLIQVLEKMHLLFGLCGLSYEWNKQEVIKVVQLYNTYMNQIGQVN